MHRFNTQVHLQHICTFSLLWTDYGGFYCLSSPVSFSAFPAWPFSFSACPWYVFFFCLPWPVCFFFNLLTCLLFGLTWSVCFSACFDLSAFQSVLTCLPYLLSCLLSACPKQYAFCLPRPVCFSVVHITCLLFRFLDLLVFLSVLNCLHSCLSWHVCFSPFPNLYTSLGNEKTAVIVHTVHALPT